MAMWAVEMAAQRKAATTVSVWTRWERRLIS